MVRLGLVSFGILATAGDEKVKKFLKRNHGKPLIMRDKEKKSYES